MGIGLGFYDYGFPGFGTGLTVFGIMFTVVFVLVLGSIIFAIVKGIGQWNKNNHSPRLTVPATIVAKRTNVSHHHHHNQSQRQNHYSRDQHNRKPRFLLCFHGTAPFEHLLQYITRCAIFQASYFSRRKQAVQNVHRLLLYFVKTRSFSRHTRPLG